jgi:hypothetical protein
LAAELTLAMAWEAQYYTILVKMLEYGRKRNVILAGSIPRPKKKKKH